MIVLDDNGFYSFVSGGVTQTFANERAAILGYLFSHFGMDIKTCFECYNSGVANGLVVDSNIMTRVFCISYLSCEYYDSIEPFLFDCAVDFFLDKNISIEVIAFNLKIKINDDNDLCFYIVRRFYLGDEEC